jgi:type I restriction enzyme S subunit
MRASGSANQANISADQIKNTNIIFPPIKEQKTIADTLSALDNKIELNNKINENLEKQAQALFKHWFIDFEYPDENGNPYKSSGGEMIESELGLIPKGWEVKSLEDFSPVITGKKNANIATDNGEYKFFTCSQESSLTDDYSFEGKAILVAGNGDFNVKFYNGKFEAYQRTYVLIPENPELAGFIYYMVKFNLDKIILNARGSVISYLTKGDLENSKIAFPNLQSFENFIETLDIINMKILSNNKQNEKLSQLRDTLLPKLMSGKIRIPLD